MKKIFITIMVCLLLIGCGKQKNIVNNGDKKVENTDNKVEEFVDFTDSLGRVVKIPKNLDKIVPSGTNAQVVLASFVPEKMIAISKKVNKKIMDSIKDFPKDKPEIGQFYGKNPNFNKEELIALNPQLIIDIGERKSSIEEDINQIQKNTGITTVFIELTPDTVEKTYDMLGKLFGKEDEAKKITEFFAKNNKIIKDGLEKINPKDRLTFIQVGGKDALAIDPAKSSHTEAVEFAGGVNKAKPKSKKDKKEEKNKDKKAKTENINMEEVLKWNPNVIFVKDKKSYEAIKSSEKWKILDAVKNDKVYLVPQDPYSWVSSPPSVNKMMGIYWAANKMYPEVFNYNVEDIAKEFKELVLNIKAN